MRDAFKLRASGLTFLLVLAGFVLAGCGGSVDTSANDYASDNSAESDTAEPYTSEPGTTEPYTSEPDTTELGGEQTEYATDEAVEDQYEEDSTQAASSTTSAGEETVLEALPPSSATASAGSAIRAGPEGKPLDEFLYMVAEDLDGKWAQWFSYARLSYSSPGVLIYEESALSIDGCEGVIYNQDGPLYCSETQTIYYPYPWTVRDTGAELEDFGDFAVAAVMAHEFAHHVQGQLGLVKNWNVYSIQMELQADCLAGVWAATIYYEGRLETGDIEEAVFLLTKIGDVPGTPSFDPNAHGTEQQRIDAFWTGLQAGDAGQCTIY